MYVYVCMHRYVLFSRVSMHVLLLVCMCARIYTCTHMYACLRELRMQVEKQSVVLASQTLGSKALPAFFSISTLLTRNAPITHMMAPPLPSLPSLQGK